MKNSISNEVAITILFATFKRDDILRKSLNGFLSLDTSGISFEIIIVDNACLESTKNIVNSYDLPITFLQCPTPGKNAAINMGLAKVSGDYIVFTDDDIIPYPQWLQAYKSAFLNYDDVSIFCGGLIPSITDWPSYIPIKDKNIIGAYCIKDMGAKDEEILPVKIWGGNMAIKSDVFIGGVTFNQSVGPNGKDYIMGSETELLARLQNQGFSGMYVANAKVIHQIRSEQLKLDWLKGRAFRQGKGNANYNIENQLLDTNINLLFNMPRYLVVRYIKDLLTYQLGKFFITSQKRTSLMYSLNMKKGELLRLREFFNNN
ncbi:glycosyltransferase [Thalassotalea atypica]|uniref:glycosyltransferase n=1 Tax=Thalassotalea atypica TaxID=2054316 RepID=UPI0025724ADA|nr:glycosyltransferase family 2 protein [Thalassotalea atypica]